MADAAQKGRTARWGGKRRGEANPLAKLNARAVSIIREQRGKVTQFVLAERFGVSQTTISYVQSGETWRHVR